MYIPPRPKPADDIIAGVIAVWTDAWPNPDKTIDLLEKVAAEQSDVEWRKAKTTAEELDIEHANPNLRTNSLMWLKDAGLKNEALREVSNQYFDLLASCADWYKTHFDINEQIHIVEEFNVLRYQTGQEYHAHYDGGTWSKRVVSPILYLNDDYEGGEIEFVNQGITIKPEPGMFLIFPANYAFRHIAHPVRTGTKYAIVTWLHDAP